MSAGFHRLGANAGKVVGWSNRRDPLAPAITLETVVKAREALDAAPVNATALLFDPGPGDLTRDQARQQGYTGDSCQTCGSARMKMAGHCQVCEACGNSTGCS